MPTKLLIYDGDCSYCRGFARLVRLLDRRKQVAVAPYDQADSHALLHAQFGETYGFTMYLFEQREVSWGREAARRIVGVVSLPRWVSKVAFYTYPSLVKLASTLTRRTRAVCGPDCAGFINQTPKRESATMQEVTLRELQKILAERTLQSS